MPTPEIEEGPGAADEVEEDPGPAMAEELDEAAPELDDELAIEDEPGEVVLEEEAPAVDALELDEADDEAFARTAESALAELARVG